ncbi:SDR family oxidoreductase [Streptomyces albus subsp. chlorinus]|uniref:SDR family NAD(P)-dependent oxidoreductase n=1 Tax=Streptomyces albus TaxID=1888 RepID=UPI00156E4FAA|nr:SDR family oxidoreductase [Streptomyces albus]NSC21114.1 SDR family oxidoreductase [Streptomyces albus subsp. chlorinus]
MTRAILVTGGATGIGLAVARHFARNGDEVVVTGRRQAPLEAAAKEIGARAVVCDHTDPEAVARLLPQLPDRLDVLVNNAGGQTDFRRSGADGLTPLEVFARDFRANLDANLLSAALTTKAVEDRLTAGGAVVSIGSIAADKGSGSYGAAKAGLASWNLDLARQLGPRDITANVVSPGYIADTEFFGDHLTPERRAHLIESTMLGRPGRPDDIAGAVAFLASPAARDITAQVLNVNGGEHGTR